MSCPARSVGLFVSNRARTCAHVNGVCAAASVATAQAVTKASPMKNRVIRMSEDLTLPTASRYSHLSFGQTSAIFRTGA